jgi:hypothetical protein
VIRLNKKKDCWMMKRVVGAFFMAISLFCYGSDDHFSLKHAELIQKRYYIIRRLEESIKTFNVIQSNVFKEKKLRNKKISHFDDRILHFFNHPAVASAVSEIASTGDVQPFYTLWDSCVAYRFLEDDLFVKEAITLLLMLYKHLLHVLQKKEHILNTDPFTENIRSKEIAEMINQAQVMHSHIQHTVLYYYPELTAMLAACHHINSHLCEHIRCDTVGDDLSALITFSEKQNAQMLVVHNSLRFYHIQRLMRSIFILSKKGVPFSSVSLDAGAYNLLKHERIKKCFLKLQKYHSLVPLFKIWKSFSTYDLIDDCLFVEDFIRLIIIVHVHIIQSEHLRAKKQNNTTTTASFDALELYQKIVQLPIPELLAMLDEMSEQYSLLLQQYEFSNTTMTWSAWIKKYWWTPPIFAGVLLITIGKYSRALQKLTDILFKKA